MSKTVEEILKAECPLFSDPASMGATRNQVIKAMREFATQEVEAYKRRLIAEVRADVKNAGPTMLIGDIALLIDTVK